MNDNAEHRMWKKNNNNGCRSFIDSSRTCPTDVDRREITRIDL